MVLEIELPAGWQPYAVITAPDGTLWSTLLEPPGLGRIDPAVALAGRKPAAFASVLRLPRGAPGAKPMQVAADAGGSLWYTRSDDSLGCHHASGDDELIGLVPGCAPYGIAAAPDGTIWFSMPGLNGIGRRPGSGGKVDKFDLPVDDAFAAMITVADDGAVWTALNKAGALARWTATGGMALITLPPDSAPVGVTPAPDGGIWYADINGGRVGHVDAAGTVADPAFDDASSRPHAVVADPAGGCWATLWSVGRLVHVDAGGAVEQFELPGREPHGLTLTDTHVWVAMESGTLAAVERR
jgi:virginiamycin B lyase